MKEVVSVFNEMRIKLWKHFFFKILFLPVLKFRLLLGFLNNENLLTEKCWFCTCWFLQIVEFVQDS